MEDNKEEIYIEDERTQTFPNCETSPQDNIKQQEPIFVMTLEIDEGKPKQIQIYADSKPGELAFEFCKENNLDFESLKQLKIQIEKLMKEHAKEDPLMLKEYEEKKSDDMSKEKTEVREQKTNEMMTKPNQKENSKDEHMLYHYEPYELDGIEHMESKKEFNEQKEKEVHNNNEKVNNYSPLLLKDNKNPNNLKIQHPNETYNKSISVSKYSNNPLSRSITDTHKSSNVKKASKLFPYEFKIQDNRTNARNNRNLYKCQSTAQSKNTIGVNHSYQSLRTRSVANSNPNGVSISRISTINSQSRSKKSIFDRLFKDSQIKRIAYRRPCHFSNTPKKRNSIVSCNNTNTSINTISLMNHYDYCSDEEYARSYQLKSSKGRIDNCSFKPNITPLNPPSLRKTPSSSKKTINIQSTESLVNYKPKIVEKKPLQDKDRYSNYHTINIGSNKTLLQSNSRKVNDNSSLYKPLRDRVIKSSQEESSYLEGIRNESYTNLYIALSGDENVKLCKSNLNLTNIPQNIQNDIHSIIETIMKNNAIYTKEDFINEMKEVFKTLSFEEKRNIINYYKMRINTFKQPIQRNCQTPYLFNSKTSSQMNSPRKSLSCSKNKEAMRRLKELKNPSNKKRNFYYVF